MNAGTEFRAKYISCIFTESCGVSVACLVLVLEQDFIGAEQLPQQIEASCPLLSLIIPSNPEFMMMSPHSPRFLLQLTANLPVNDADNLGLH